MNSYGIRLTERMCGFVKMLDPGREHLKHPFEFTIHAFTKNFFQYPICLNFEGVAKAPGFPLTDEQKYDDTNMAIYGEMKISLKGVSYDVQCKESLWGSWRLRGEKKYIWGIGSWKKLRQSLVWLPGKIFKNHVPIGQVELNYSQPLWKFPLGLSWVHESDAFTPHRKLAEKLFKIGEILFPNTSELGERNVLIHEIEKQIEVLPKGVRLGLSGILRFIQLLSFVVRGKNVVQFFQKHALLNVMLLPIASTVLYPLFSQRQYLARKGQNIIEKPLKNESEPWMAQSMPPHVRIEDEKVIEADCVVVGSGAGGAAFAYEMARKGKAVVVLEEGHYFRRNDLSGIASEMMGKLYTRSGIQFSVSNSPLWIPTGTCVGGTTFINSGTCMRTPVEVLKKWEDQLGLKINLERYFPEVEEMLGGVQKVNTRIQGGISKVLEKGLMGTGYVHEPLMRAEIGCDGQSVCVSGCPTGAKRSTAVSYLPEALKKNAFLFSHMKVKKILYEKGEVKGVVAGVPNYGNEFDLTIHAKVVALAAGAFGTPEVLHHSQIYSDHLGKHLSIHPAFTIGGLFHEPVRESKFVPQSVGVFGFEEDDFVLEGYTLPVDVIPVAMAQWGAELRQLMDEVNHFTNFSSMLKDTSEGELIFTPWGTIPKYFVNKKLMKRAQRSVQFMANVFFNAGAKKIYLPFQGLKVVTSRKELEGLDQLEVHPSRAILSAHHPLGTCRMAGSKDQGAISEEGEWFGMKNLLVVDGSAIPGPIGVNPQVTIMANALRIANIWSERC